MHFTIWQKFIALTVAACLLVQCSPEPDSDVDADPDSIAPVLPGGRAAPEAPKLPRPAGLAVEGAEWETLSKGYIYTDSPAGDAAGRVYFAAPVQNRIYRIEPDNSISVFAEQTKMAMGLVWGGDQLIGCQNHAAQIVAYSADGKERTLYTGEMTKLPNRPNMPGEFCNDVAASSAGHIWFTDRINKRVMHLAADGTLKTVAEGFRPNGTVLSADEQTLLVTDSNEPRLWAFAVLEDGSLKVRPNFFDPIKTVEKLGNEEIAPGRPGTNGATVDSDGRFYVASFYGIQVFGADGKYIGVIDKPKGFVSNLSFAGPDKKYLYASGLDGIFRLPMQVQGVSR